MKDLLLVLTNYSRPANMPQVIRAWREQTVKADHLVVVDNSDRNNDGEHYPNAAWRMYGVDDVWRMTRNLGCSCHLAPALMLSHRYRYTLFADDDLLPGPKAIETVLAKAKELKDDFATIGQVGRNFRLDQPSGKRYVYGNAPDGMCDVTCRCSLVRSEFLPTVLQFRQALVEMFGDEIADLTDIHDDLLTCLGIQGELRLPSYCFTPTDPNCRLIKTELGSNDDKSVYKRPQHLVERNKFVNMSLEVGWKPVTY